ncbi:MAG: TolC family protein, partial [Burkholderiales bacterium]|nr:TolC family protein [Burkholderiales bacterium]
AAAARAAQAAQRVRAGALQPRVELRVRSDHGRNVGGAEQRDSDTAAEIVLNWNLYDGGAARARERQRAAETGQAVQQGLQACRDLAQTLAIAYNDTVRLAEQRELLQRNAAAIERARDAYRQQFEIGQRSLLDLLNAEDEAYTARRALLDAETDRAIAYLRLQTGLGQLLSQLGVATPAPEPAAAEALPGGDADPFPGCPASTATG